MAHITGGGIPGNLPRILPKGLAAKINQGVWEALPIFSLIQKQGNIDEQEMYHVFNMGLGMIVITAPRNATKLLQDLPGAILIGEVMEQKDERRVIVQGL
jgi:phosphoribosylformylglycinamidine cyclo-ligase